MLLAGVMVGNAVFNWTFFKRRWFGVSFWYFLPYGLLVAMLIGALAQVEPTGAMIFGVYALYLPYALVWSYRTWQMNS